MLHVTRHEFQGCCLELGVTTVLNRLIDMAPQPQRAPLALVLWVFNLYAFVHAWSAGMMAVW